MEQREIRDLPEILFPTCQLIDLPESGCKWPYEGLMCCGRQRLEGRPYCETHYERIKPAGGTKPYTPNLTAQAQIKLIEGRVRAKRPCFQNRLAVEDIG